MTGVAPHLGVARWRARRLVSVWLPGDAPETGPDGASGGPGGVDGPGRSRQRCGACGRPLRRYSPSGLGPVCERKLTPAPATIPVPRRDDHIPGQAELPLVEHQPTFWSP